MIELTQLERLQIVREYMQQYRRLRIHEINNSDMPNIRQAAAFQGEVNAMNDICAELDVGIEAHKTNVEAGGVVRNNDPRTLTPYALEVLLNWLYERFEYTKAIHDPYTSDDYSRVDEAKQEGRLEKMDDLLDDVRMMIDERRGL